MTTYIQALRRESDGRWDMTSGTGSTNPHAIGYCAGWREMTAHDVARLGEGFAASLHNDIEAKRPHQAKYHTDGHATEDEACECYRQYQLDNELKFLTKPNEEADELHKCHVVGCGVFSAGLAVLGRHRCFWLCDSHRNRDEVAKLAATRGE